MKPFFITFALSIVYQSALASGMRVHLWAAELSLSQISEPDLKDLIEKNLGAYKAGAIFPDSGYVISHPYGELAHWSDFLNAYYNEILDQCPPNRNALQKCQKLISHFLGSLSHTIKDIRFDRYIVQKSAEIDFAGSIDKAQSVLDPDLDFIAIFEHRRGLDMPEFITPIPSLKNVFMSFPMAKVTKADLFFGTHILTLGYGLEPAVALARYKRVKKKLRASWAYANYLTAKGGVYDSAEVIAKAIDLVWKHYRFETKVPLFRNLGQWPNVDFFLGATPID